MALESSTVSERRAVSAHLTPVFARERMGEVMLEIEPLLAAHWREVAHYADIALAPDYTQYQQAERHGALWVFTVRLRAELVGYAVYWVRQALHYSGSVQASQDILFITPEHRGIGAKFLRWCDEQLREEGVQVVYHHVKLAHNFGSLLKRLGYEPIETVWGRRLDRG